jgi:hypothetical protein
MQFCNFRQGKPCLTAEQEEASHSRSSRIAESANQQINLDLTSNFRVQSNPWTPSCSGYKKQRQAVVWKNFKTATQHTQS